VRDGSLSRLIEMSRSFPSLLASLKLLPKILSFRNIDPCQIEGWDLLLALLHLQSVLQTWDFFFIHDIDMKNIYIDGWMSRKSSKDHSDGIHYKDKKTLNKNNKVRDEWQEQKVYIKLQEIQMKDAVSKTVLAKYMYNIVKSR